MWGGYDYGWGMGFGMIGMVLFWVLLVLGIAALVKWVATGARSSERQNAGTALDILDERYARGEIGRDEYEQKKRDIKG